MDLHVLFIQRREDYPGEWAPDALLAWSEWNVDDDPDGFAAEVAAELDEAGDIAAHRVIRIRVDQDAIRQLLLAAPVVEGTIEP